MDYRNFGQTNIKISEISFGCMSLGKSSKSESMKLLHLAIDNRINYFDTADIYDGGNNELLLGEVLKSCRNKVFLATKVGNVIKRNGDKGFDWNPSKEHILKSVDESLRRLQTDYIDLYQLQGGTIDDPIDETIEAFEMLKQKGKILHYGISSIRPNVIREYVKRSNIVSVMMQYSYLDRRPEEEILSLLRKNSIGVLARGVLAQGLLVDKPAKEYIEYSKEEVSVAQAALQKAGSDNSCLAISYVLHEPMVSSAVIGFRTAKQLADVLNCVKGITAEQYGNLQSAQIPMKYVQHR